MFEIGTKLYSKSLDKDLIVIYVCLGYKCLDMSNEKEPNVLDIIDVNDIKNLELGWKYKH